jgi:Dolichyl-phosphate-mannose-protein mannosyltransferase
MFGAEHAGLPRLVSSMDQIVGPPSTELRSRVREATWFLVILSSLVLLGVSIYRATLPFGFDESQSFASFTGQPEVLRTATHHPLNTALMRWCSRLFGNSEFALRLPNVVAHGLYLLAVLALIKRFRDPVLQGLGFVLFNLNLLMIEYFTMARGYGLALAFEMVGLYLFVRAYERVDQRHLARDLSLAVAAGSLAVLSNYAWVNYYLPLLVAVVWLLLTDGSLRRVSRRHIGTALTIIAAGGLFLSYILSKLLKLQRDRQLFLGGHNSFVSDTIPSLVHCALFSTIDSPGAVRVVSGILIGLFVLVLPLAVYQWFSKGEATLGLLVLLLAAAVALPILEHRFFGALFPIERAALYYLPLYAVVLVYAFNVLGGVPSASWTRVLGPTLAAATAVVVGWSFLGGFRERSPCAWWVDTHNHNREVLELIERDRANRSPDAPKVKVRANWRMVPSLDFYRKTRNYTWLARVAPGPIPNPDYIYNFETNLGTAGTTRLASYRDIGMVLLRVDSAARR